MHTDLRSRWHMGPTTERSDRRQLVDLFVIPAVLGLPMPRLSGLMVGVLALVLAACGGEAEKPKPPMPAASSAKKDEAPAAAGGPEVVGDYVILGENARAKQVETLFTAYHKRDILALTDPMLSNVTAFVQKRVVEKSDRIEGPDADHPILENMGIKKCKGEECAKVPPLERDFIMNFKLTTIMTGMPIPKAVLQDAQNESYVIQRGDRVGLELAVVEAITQYSVRLNVPGQKEPVILSIAPPLTPVDQKAEEQNTEL